MVKLVNLKVAGKPWLGVRVWLKRSHYPSHDDVQTVLAYRAEKYGRRYQSRLLDDVIQITRIS